jgi:hypothetical protein
MVTIVRIAAGGAALLTACPPQQRNDKGVS